MSKAPKRPGVKRFDRAPQANIPRSTFDLSHPYKCTFDSGKLYPFLLQEVYPADSFSVRTAAFIRLATPLYPTMDNLHVETFYFFIADRLVWKNFQKFMGEQDNPGDSTDFLIPTLTSTVTTGFATGELADYFGLPLGVPDLEVNALPFRCYNLCWNQWFRDENLQDSLTVSLEDGPDNYSNYVTVRRRGKRKDYISSALPFPQKGPGVELPLGGKAPLWTDQADILAGKEFLWASSDPAKIARVGTAGSFGIVSGGDIQANQVTVFADLENATAATINDLRQAFAIQKLQERDARGGTRYTEIIRSHFLTVSPDQRLQRPEYLGGGYAAVQMNTVPQTSGTPQDTGGYTTTPQGNLSAYAVGTLQGHGFSKSFVEHGYILGLFSVRADLTYQQRLDRLWSRQTKYDLYWPALQSLGEQPIYNKEVWCDGTAADDEVWGYQERWSELRQQLGVVAGKFRSTDTESLDPWHYALDFETRPTLNDVFIEDNPPVKRTIAVQTEPEFLMDAWHQIRAARPLPVYSVPGYIDHF